jgi:ABC-2 type transport system ATP-binding protein
VSAALSWHDADHSGPRASPKWTGANVGKGHDDRLAGVVRHEQASRWVPTGDRIVPVEGAVVVAGAPVTIEPTMPPERPMTRANGDAVIACEGLGKSFNGVPVVRNVDLRIAAGSIVALIGPSGCGKTTTVRLLTGIQRPTTGWAAINGTPSVRLTHRQRQQVGYLPQIPALFPELSLWENLSFHASMYGLRLRRRRRLQQLLTWVELWEHREKRVREVSGGMQRRLALAASFVHDPPILFLDEPTAGIDPILRAKFWARFRELRESGRTIFVTTQYVAEAAYCDFVGLLSEGALLGIDTPENLRGAAFAGEVIDVEFSQRIAAKDLAPIAALDVVVAAPEEVEPRRWRIVVRDAERGERELKSAIQRAGLPVVDVQEHIVDFDEAFVRVIERSRRGGPTAAQPMATGVDQ